MIKESRRLLLNSIQIKRGHFVRNVSYIQGQEPEPKIREYFYYIDHEGMVSKYLYMFINCNQN